MDSEKDVRKAALKAVNLVVGAKEKQRQNRIVNASSLQRFAEFKVLVKSCIKK